MTILPSPKKYWTTSCAVLSGGLKHPGGLQPFAILSITNRNLLEKIKPIANNQLQIPEGSHVLVFAAWEDVTGDQIERVFEQITRERNLSPDALNRNRTWVTGYFAGLSKDERFNITARQAYIAFGVVIVAAADQQVDATPMEGFKPAGQPQKSPPSPERTGHRIIIHQV